MSMDLYHTVIASSMCSERTPCSLNGDIRSNAPKLHLPRARVELGHKLSLSWSSRFSLSRWDAGTEELICHIHGIILCS